MVKVQNVSVRKQRWNEPYGAVYPDAITLNEAIAKSSKHEGRMWNLVKMDLRSRRC